MNSANFFESLPLCDDAAKILTDGQFAPLPEDWLIVVADVKNSTHTIAKGNYRAVNFIAASVLMATLNITKPNHLPFMFGGDGASICIPPEYSEKVMSALQAIRQMAAREFQLHLRIGLVKQSLVLKSGHHILVAKYKVSDDYHQAFFKGDGLNFAERYLKQHLTEEAAENADTGELKQHLQGLECRWNTVPSPHGETLALLIKVNIEDPPAKQQLYQQIQIIQMVSHPWMNQHSLT